MDFFLKMMDFVRILMIILNRRKFLEQNEYLFEREIKQDNKIIIDNATKFIVKETRTFQSYSVKLVQSSYRNFL